MLTDQEIEIANRTAHTRGCVGRWAKAPRVVARLATRRMKILDYGAGPEAQHTETLRAMGFDVVAHEIGGNIRAGVHDPEALTRRYDLVMLSNVLNQPSTAALDATLREVAGLVGVGGFVVANYPGRPRKLPLGLVRSRLAEVFDLVEIEPEVYALTVRGLEPELMTWFWDYAALMQAAPFGKGGVT